MRHGGGTWGRDGNMEKLANVKKDLPLLRRQTNVCTMTIVEISVHCRRMPISFSARDSASFRCADFLGFLENWAKKVRFCESVNRVKRITGITDAG